MKILISTLICLSFAANAIAQTLQFPKEIVYYQKKPDKKEASVEEGGRYTETRTFHPIGWSADGKFAYAAFYNDYVDGTSIAVIVKDMVSDNIIWETSANGSDAKTDLWKKVKTETEKALTGYKIKQETKIDYRKGSWHRINGQEYKFALTTNDRIQVDCRAKGLGIKTLYKQDITPEDFEYQAPYSADVIGIIKSPYEDRVVVLYYLFGKGFEFIDDEYYELVGCQLLTGFK